MNDKRTFDFHDIPCSGHMSIMGAARNTCAPYKMQPHLSFDLYQSGMLLLIHV